MALQRGSAMGTRHVSTTALIIALLMVSFVPVSLADTVTYSTRSPLNADFEFGAVQFCCDVQEDFVIDLAPVYLPPFDPALGRLTGVSFSMDGTVEVSAFLLGPLDFVSYFEVEFESILQVGLLYDLGPSTIFAYGVQSGIFIDCVYAESNPSVVCGDSYSNVLDFATDGAPVSWPLERFETLTSGTRWKNAIPGLSLGFAMSDTNFFPIAGSPRAMLEGRGVITDAIVSVTYEFTPVPVPAAVWLLGSALGLLGWLRKRAV